MVHPTDEVRLAAENWVCVRVVDMRGVDLELLRFDFDLTFAVLLMHPDGTVYHRYGGRNAESPTAWISMSSFLRLLGDTLVDHAVYRERPTPPAFRAKRTIMDDARFVKRLGEKRDQCIHCHMIYSAEREAGLAAGTFATDDIWRWPGPDRLGLTLDPERQSLVTAVAKRSPAAQAGLEAGDLLQAISGQGVRTANDVQAVLEDTGKHGVVLPVTVRRAEELMTLRFDLEPGWKIADPWAFAWRPSKWPLTPNPGFGGVNLSATAKRELGRRAGALAFRVTYLITWGEEARFGKNAQKAGVKKVDILLGVEGATELRNHDHFQSWFRLKATAGASVQLEIARGKERLTVTLPVVD